MFINYNYPNWKTAHIMIPELVNKAFEVTAFSSNTESYITWFSNDFTQLVPEEENYRDIVGMITQAFIIRMIDKLEIEKELSGFLFKPNDAIYRAQIENAINTLLSKYHAEHGATLQDDLARFVLGMKTTEFGEFRLEPDSDYYKSDYKDFVRFVTKLDIMKANFEYNEATVRESLH